MSDFFIAEIRITLHVLDYHVVSVYPNTDQGMRYAQNLIRSYIKDRKKFTVSYE